MWPLPFVPSVVNLNDLKPQQTTHFYPWMPLCKLCQPHWQYNENSMFAAYYASPPVVPLCLHVKWYRGASSVSLVSFHIQGPRLEAVRRRAMGTFRNRLGACLHPRYFQCYNVSGGCLWLHCDGWTIYRAHTWAVALVQVEKHVELVGVNQTFFPSFSETTGALSIY